MDWSRITLFDRQGWQCPICGKIYSPDTSMCLDCIKGTTVDSTPKSEQPERKAGVWLIRNFGSDAQCSECKTFFSDVYDMENSDNYCRHCGTKMEGLRRTNNEKD